MRSASAVGVVPVGGGHDDGVVGARLGEHRLGRGVVGGDHREAGDPARCRRSRRCRRWSSGSSRPWPGRRPCRPGPSPGPRRWPDRARSPSSPAARGRSSSSNGLRRSSSIQATPIVPPMPSVVAACAVGVHELGEALDRAGGGVDAVDGADLVEDAGVDSLLHVAVVGRRRRRCGGRRRRCPRWLWRRARRRSSPWCR